MNTYPPDWLSGDIQRAAYERAGWRCEHCGAQFPIGDTRHATIKNRDGKSLILTVHHIDMNPANCDWTNLLCCCQKCHLHIQTRWQPGGAIPLVWDSVPAWIIERRLPYVVNPQMRMW